ncbi:MAG: hypothetical protein U0354_00205 [Candidatus Sericytochromatia bacterium]
MNKKVKVSILTLLFCLNSFNYTNNSIAEEQTVEELSPEEAFNKNLGIRANTDDTNFHYYPKLELDSPNLIGNAATLKQNEVFARASLYGLYNRGSINTNGQLITTSGLPSHVYVGVQLGWGIFENLLFTGIVTGKYFFSGNPAPSDAWLNLKYKILEAPFILSIQGQGKMPIGSSSSNPPYSTGDYSAGGMLLATKSFESFFIQAGAGYNYRFPLQGIKNNQIIPVKYADQINYFLDIGYNLKDYGFMFDLSGFGNYSIGSYLETNPSFNYITLRPNITYKFNNMEVSLAGYFPISGLNMDYPIGVNAAYTIKNAFEYSKVFNLMFSKKIDPQTLEKIKDFSSVTKGKDLYINTCSKCHALVDPEVKSIDDWTTTVDRYREKKVLTKSEYSALVDFLKFYKEN